MRMTPDVAYVFLLAIQFSVAATGVGIPAAWASSSEVCGQRKVQQEVSHTRLGSGRCIRPLRRGHSSHTTSHTRSRSSGSVSNYTLPCRLFDPQTQSPIVSLEPGKPSRPFL